MQGFAPSPTAGSRGAHREYALSNVCNPRMPRLDRKNWRRYDTVPSLSKGLLHSLRMQSHRLVWGMCSYLYPALKREVIV